MKITKQLKEIVGSGYDDFWKFKGRYRIVKGGRASKKSKTTALWYIHHLMQYPGANLLAVRKTYNSLRNSCFAELKWAIDRLGYTNDWKIKTSPLEMNRSDGGSIFFRGLDNVMKLTSITADKGKLCWVWVEEAFELAREEDFNMLDESVRGKVDKGLFKQLTLTFNPWSDTHWLKRRFFDLSVPDKNVFTLTTDYTCNKFFVLYCKSSSLYYNIKNAVNSLAIDVYSILNLQEVRLIPKTPKAQNLKKGERTHGYD